MRISAHRFGLAGLYGRWAVVRPRMARAASSDVAPQASEGYAARARALVGSVGLGYDSVPGLFTAGAVGNEHEALVTVSEVE